MGSMTLMGPLYQLEEMMHKRLSEQVVKRAETVLGKSLNQPEAMLLDILLDIALQTSPTAVWRTPMVISSMIVDSIANYRNQAEEQAEETKSIMPPEAYVFQFFSRCAEAESALLDSGRGMTFRDKLARADQRLRER